MKRWLYKLTFGAILIGLVVFGIEIFSGYMATHPYYHQMLSQGAHRWMIVWALVASALPILYLLYYRKFALKKFLRRLFFGVVFFGIAHVILKDGFVFSGLIPFVINMLILFVMGAYFIGGSLALGTFLSQRFLKFKEHRREEMLINFGLGLGVLLLAVRLMIMFNVFFSALTWVIFVGLGVLMVVKKDLLHSYKPIIHNVLGGFHVREFAKQPRKVLGLILIVISILYYFYGFQLSFIPYSTAWDANHAYMYMPKIWSLNNGVFWTDGPGGSMVGLWHAFIAFWFSLIKPISGWFWLKGDTIAVAMNFLSGLLVLVFGLGLIKKVVDFVGDKIRSSPWIKELSFATGRFFLLLWLTSGMGAFLVFVDNKTDLGLMAMLILAMLSGFIFIRHLSEKRSQTKTLDKEMLKYIFVSAFMFGLAILTKQTATTDVLIFIVLLMGLWFNVWMGIGAGALGLYAVTLVRPANAADFLLPHTPLTPIFLWIGIISLVIGLVILIRKASDDKHRVMYAHRVSYGALWLGVLLGIVFLFKGTFVAYDLVKKSNFGVGELMRGVLFAQTDTRDPAQALTDNSALPKVSLAQCQAMKFSKEELEKNLTTPPSQNEDVGRYVGYGRHEFNKSDKLFRLGYGVLNIFFHKEGKCYGFESSAKLLCNNANAVDGFDTVVLEKVLGDMSDESQGYNLLSGALVHYRAENIANSEPVMRVQLMKDKIVALRQFYQNNTIKYQDSPEKIFVPYRYLIPLNVSYNWSLQNLSSYYTDIGFVWLFAFMMLICGIKYAIARRHQELLVIGLTGLVGRLIWWIIGGAILWYGIGQIVWLILSVVLFVQYLASEQEDTSDSYLLYVTLAILAMWGMIQLVLNFVRISSQGASGPFVWYKMSAGQAQEYTDQLQPNSYPKIGYSQKEVFDLQFPHYNFIIDRLKDRKDEDGVMIAGTYLQYFLDNQKNLVLDGMLGGFAKTVSDGDSCYTYKRLQDQHLKYLVIDPNIGTVVMGEGNEALFYRFFAKKDPLSGKIEQHGAMSMFAQLWTDGYIDLAYTSNLGAKYAFNVPDETFISAFGEKSADDLVYLRAQLSIARFFPQEPQLTNFVGTMFSNRMQNGAAVSDIADVFGKMIDEQKVMKVVQTRFASNNNFAQVEPFVAELTQDERFVVVQYLSLYSVYNSNPSQFQMAVQNILSQSLGGSNQIMFFELR